MVYRLPGKQQPYVILGRTVNSEPPEYESDSGSEDRWDGGQPVWLNCTFSQANCLGQLLSLDVLMTASDPSLTALALRTTRLSSKQVGIRLE